MCTNYDIIPRIIPGYSQKNGLVKPEPCDAGNKKNSGNKKL